MGIKKAIAHLSALCLLLPALPAQALNEAAKRPGNLSQAQALKQRQLEQARKQARSVQKVRQLIKDKIPFEPGTLFTRNWQQKLASALDQMPEMKVRRAHYGPLKGVYIVGELTLPDKVELEGDTVILARRVTFQGRDVTVKGPHSVYFFAVDSFSASEKGGTMTIDTSGRGRKEWLESLQQKKSEARPLSPTIHRAVFIPVGGSPKAEFRRAAPWKPQVVDDRSGAPGQDGDFGLPGGMGDPGLDGTRGADGSCLSGLIEGGRGTDGRLGGQGRDGGNGEDGRPGEKGGDITLSITDPGDATAYRLISKGGNGGEGGDGGRGGQGGTGGKGGDGGNGAGCQCAFGGVGNGGRGGEGGGGGYGGRGGNGGKGGAGGSGGVITVNYPAGYNTNNIDFEYRPGAPGGAGAAGIGGSPGYRGDGGKGGQPGSLPNCGSASPGQDGPGGLPGEYGPNGGVGQVGDSGSDGAIVWNPSGGDGGYTSLEPCYVCGSGGGGGCVDYYWVYYTCSNGTCWMTGYSYAGCLLP